ncbi:MAG: hypothetical protein ACI85Q_002456 [Salibacteraceae bacterium]|jgi:hypothetical protein
MKNKCQKVKILDSDLDKVRIKFIESDIVMPISKAMLKAKVKAGFYKVINPAFEPLQF